MTYPSWTQPVHPSIVCPPLLSISSELYMSFSTFPAVNSNMIPVSSSDIPQFRSPFFESLIDQTAFFLFFFQSAGISFVSQILPNSSFSILVEVFRSALMASGGMPLGPAAFPFFRCLMALLSFVLLACSHWPAKVCRLVVCQASRLVAVCWVAPWSVVPTFFAALPGQWATFRSCIRQVYHLPVSLWWNIALLHRPCLIPPLPVSKGLPRSSFGCFWCYV